MATVAWGIWEHKLYTGREERAKVASLTIHLGLTAFLLIVELQNPGTCMSCLCFLFLQVLFRLVSIFFPRYMPSWILIMPPEAPEQFSLQLLPHLWEDFTFQIVLKNTRSTFTLTLLTELSLGSGESQDTGSVLCSASV